MKIKNYIMNVLKGLRIWLYCTLAELAVACSVYGFYLVTTGGGYRAVIAFIIAVVWICISLSCFAFIGEKFTTERKCSGRCQEHGATKENK